MIKIQQGIIVRNAYIHFSEILPHEKVIKERSDRYKEYIVSNTDYKVIPSLLICNETNVLIDGHHRLTMLKELGYKYFPATFLNYALDAIVPHIDPSKKITKTKIIDAAISNNLLDPKSSYHHIMDDDNNPRPIILLSKLSEVELNHNE